MKKIKKFKLLSEVQEETLLVMIFIAIVLLIIGLLISQEVVAHPDYFLD